MLWLDVLAMLVVGSLLDAVEVDVDYLLVALSLLDVDVLLSFFFDASMMLW